MAEVTTIGNYAGIGIFAVSAADIAAAPGNIVDSGPLLFGASPLPGTGPAVTTKIQGYKDITMQCTGAGTNIAITAFFTIDQQTALGNGSEWVKIPSPSTEAANQWQNPLTGRGTALLAKFNLIALRFTAQAAISGPPVGALGVLLMASH
jgi:hypothetical protein